ncbi:unnamed protein product [Dovyalis caffra]|uniref:Ankyrin repeat-containing protein n=1 Tax=Dovyalis caffra TaxID=77055 RepID=A0AAV1SI30_9ROSI|nr:unnamed protein product [Dovyalis caffra]
MHESSETILRISCLAGRTEFVKELLKKKADLATRLNPVGFSPFQIASANGFVEIVRELLTVNSELGKLKSSDGRTTLHCAAVTGMVPVIKELLLFCPASKDILTSKGETALHLVVRNNQFEAFRAMVAVLKPLNIKELLNVTDEDGSTVSHLATAKKQTLASFSFLSLFFLSVWPSPKGRCRILKSLLGGQEIDKGTINVNAVNKIGLTTLDLLDVSQQMEVDAADYMVRELLQGAGALRAKELGTVVDITDQVARVSTTISASSPQNLAEEVKQTPAGTQNALMVVAVLIAGMAYQGILKPSAGNYSSETDDTLYYYAMIASGNGLEFIIFRQHHRIFCVVCSDQFGYSGVSTQGVTGASCALYGCKLYLWSSTYRSD